MKLTVEQSAILQTCKRPIPFAPLIGTWVEIYNICSQPQLNGIKARAVDFSNDRYIVEWDDLSLKKKSPQYLQMYGEKKKARLKPANVKLWVDPEVKQQKISLINKWVEIYNICSQPQLNGIKARAVDFSNDRYIVEWDHLSMKKKSPQYRQMYGEKKKARLKPANVKLWVDPEAEQKKMSRCRTGGSIVRVTASAGSGKTTTLLHLAAHAVTQCGHERINYATFTTAAAKDGKERMMRSLEKRTQTDNLQSSPVIEARTLHSFAYQLLEDYRRTTRKNSASNEPSLPPRMWSEKKLKKWITSFCESAIEEFLQPCYRELQFRAHGPSKTKHSNEKLEVQKGRAKEQVEFFIYKSLVLFTQSAFDIDTFEEKKNIFGRNYYPAVLFHQNKGEAWGFKRSDYNRKVEFYSNQAAACWRIIEKDIDIRTFDLDMKRVQLLKLRIPGTILLVDESQDMDECQIDFFIHQQAKLHHHVYAVGDPAQAIYGFRGAKPKYLLQLECQEKQLLTHTFRFGPRICNIANMILFAKEKSDQTRTDCKGRPIQWDPYRTKSGVPEKECRITTNESILKDWKSGVVTLIAFRNITLLLNILPLFGFPLNEGDDIPDDESTRNEAYSYQNVKRPRGTGAFESIPIVSKDNGSDKDDEDDYLPISEHHLDLDKNVTENDDDIPTTGSRSHGFPRVHLNGKGQSSGRSLWLKTLKQVESAYRLYELSTEDPNATGFLDPNQFPDFAKRVVSWRSFCDEVEFKELTKYSNVIGVVSKCRQKTLEAMETFRREVILKNVSAEEADIIITTCHSAKGMEWERVQLCDDFIDLCKFEKDTDNSHGSPTIRAMKRQKVLPKWKFGFQSWGDDVNLLYVACTRTKRELCIPPSSSLIRVAKAFDELHEWKRMKPSNPGLGTFVITIDGVKAPLSEDDALGFYESLVRPLRAEYDLSAEERIADSIFGINNEEPTNLFDEDRNVVDLT